MASRFRYPILTRDCMSMHVCMREYCIRRESVRIYTDARFADSGGRMHAPYCATCSRERKRTERKREEDALVAACLAPDARKYYREAMFVLAFCRGENCFPRSGEASESLAWVLGVPADRKTKKPAIG